VDAFVLDLLEERVLTSRDFVELSNGVCRVRAPLTHDFALTLPKWRQLMAPVVAHLAQAFRGSVGREHRVAVAPRTASSHHATVAHTSAQSPLKLTLKEIAAATGLSLVACSRIRSGARLAHPRHWDALLELAER
jgi:hypothetical protein